MLQYREQEDYGGQTYTILLTPNTGYTEGERRQRTHRLETSIGDVQKSVDDNVPEDQVPDRIAAARQSLKDEIDGVPPGNIDGIMLGLGFERVVS